MNKETTDIDEQVTKSTEEQAPVEQHSLSAPESDPTESNNQSNSSSQPQGIHIQLIPYSDTEMPPSVREIVERQIKDGQILRIGRLVVKEGQPAATQRGHRGPSDEDIWYSSKVVSRIHAEVWAKEGQVYVRDIGSSSGTFLNKMRLSPSGKESRPYPLKQGDVLQFGIDYKGRSDDIYRSVMVKIGFHDQSWLKNLKNSANNVKFRTALKSLLASTNPYASSSNNEEKTTEEEEAAGTDCCICIGAIAPFQALFIAPCSHAFHFKCVAPLVTQSPMFQCPLCRQVANLTASVSMDSLYDNDDSLQNDDEVDENLSKLQIDTTQTRTNSIMVPNAGISASRQVLSPRPHDIAEAADVLSPSAAQAQSTKSSPQKRPSLVMRFQSLLGRSPNGSSSEEPSSNTTQQRRHTAVDIASLASQNARLIPRSESTWRDALQREILGESVEMNFGESDPLDRPSS